MHCHQDEQLGQYVRLNTNSYLVEFWPFFQPYFTFPHTQRVGTEIEPFKDEAEYLNFLKTNPKAKLLWMDHHDLQAVANMYQINVHILTVGVASLDGPAARWTHLSPDDRLKQFSINQPKLNDM